MRLIPCEVCESDRHQFLFEGKDRFFGAPGDFKIVQCEECGLIFVNPQPESAMLKKYYPEVYYAPKPSHYRQYSWLRRKVLEEYFGYGLRSNLPKSLRFLRKTILLQFKAKYRHSIPFSNGGRLLDIGCGNGTELYRLKAMGWNVYGVEIDDRASEMARSKGLQVFTGDIFGANYPDHFFHVVRMKFVLEHLPNPKETLIEIKRILAPQGRIYISIQNARSLNYWLFGARWFSLDVPRHLFSFTPRTIQRLLSSLGLKVKTIRFDSGTRTFLASLQYLANDRHQRGSMTESNQPIADSRFLKYFFCSFLWVVDRLRLGDLMHLEIIKT